MLPDKIHDVACQEIEFTPGDRGYLRVSNLAMESTQAATTKVAG